MVRFRFGEFTLSRQRRMLLREGREVALIPKYFDLLLLLVERRQEAVHRREIFDRVWGDVIVSDSALSQAIRTIRRALDEDPKEPKYIRTVSRHGYQFVFEGVIEEQEGVEGTSAATPVITPEAPAPSAPASQTAAGIPLWLGAAQGGALAGLVAGAIGGLLIVAGASAPVAVIPVLAVVAAAAGGAGGLSVGAGIELVRARVHGPRDMANVVGGVVGGGLLGLVVEWLLRSALPLLVGLELSIGGALEGALIGACAGVGLSLSQRIAPSAWTAAVVTAGCCAVAGLVLTLTDRVLVGGTLHAIADASQGAVTFAPLGWLIGEPGFGPVARAIAACGECAVFGAGLALGTWRRMD